MRTRFLHSAAVCLVFCSVISLARGQSPASKSGPEVAVEWDVKVAVRDGTKLALDLYLPAANGKPLPGRHPTILVRTPYDKNRSTAEARWFAARGYAVVYNDCRGRYASEGVWRMIVDDPNDGYDICSWIVKQPWSSGKIGTMGTSYVGGTQHANHPASRA